MLLQPLGLLLDLEQLGLALLADENFLRQCVQALGQSVAALMLGLLQQAWV